MESIQKSHTLREVLDNTVVTFKQPGEVHTTAMLICDLNGEIRCLNRL